MKEVQKPEEPGKSECKRPSLRHEQGRRQDSEGPLPSRGHLSLDKVRSLTWGWKFVNTVNVLIVTVEKQWADVETVCQVLLRACRSASVRKAGPQALGAFQPWKEKGKCGNDRGSPNFLSWGGGVFVEILCTSDKTPTQPYLLGHSFAEFILRLLGPTRLSS